MFRDQITQGVRIHELVESVGSQDEHIMGFHRQCLMIDLHMLANAQRPGKVAGVRRYPNSVIPGQLLHLSAAQAVYPRIPDMKYVGRGRLDDQGAEGTYVTSLVVVTVFAFAGLGVEPGTDRKSTRLNSSHVKISYAVF